MANDPYGFPETSTGTASADATTSLWMGVASAAMTSLGMCLMYLPYFIALPLGAYAAWRGWRVVGGAVAGDPRDRSMATAGMISGGISAFVSLLFILFILLYLVLILVYVVVIVAVVASGEGPPP